MCWSTHFPWVRCFRIKPHINWYFISSLSMVQSSSLNSTIFVYIPYHTESNKPCEPVALDVCTWIKGDSTNRWKRVAWNDVTKHFPFHKAAISTNLLESFKDRKVKCTIKRLFVVLILCQPSSGVSPLTYTKNQTLFKHRQWDIPQL